MSATADAVGPRWLRPALLAGLLTLVLGAMAAFAVRGSRAAAAGPYGQFIGQVASSGLASGGRAGQTFLTDQPGLTRLDVLVENAQPATLTLHVRSAPDAVTDLAAVTRDLPLTERPSLVTFSFEALPIAAGQPLYFWLESSGNAVKVWGTDADVYTRGEARFDEPLAARGVRDLAFWLYYQPSAREALETIMARIAAGRPGILGAPLLAPALTAAYMLGLAGLLVVVVVRLRL